jgi:hypothetical protein
MQSMIIDNHKHSLGYLILKAFDNRTTSARELLRQVQASRFRKANPKLDIKLDVHSRPTPPTAVFQFIDETTKEFETAQSKVNEMMFQVHLKAMQLDAEYEMEGKNIDDL